MPVLRRVLPRPVRRLVLRRVTATTRTLRVITATIHLHLTAPRSTRARADATTVREVRAPEAATAVEEAVAVVKERSNNNEHFQLFI